MIDKIDVQDTIKLDDNKEYLVAGKALYENVNYLFLVNVKEYTMKFAALTGNQLIILNNEKDQSLIEKITPMILKSTSDSYKELLENDEE